MGRSAHRSRYMRGPFRPMSLPMVRVRETLRRSQRVGTLLVSRCLLTLGTALALLVVAAGPAAACDASVDPSCDDPGWDADYGGAYAEDPSQTVPYYDDPYYDDTSHNDPYYDDTSYDDTSYNDPFYDDTDSTNTTYFEEDYPTGPTYLGDPYGEDPATWGLITGSGPDSPATTVPPGREPRPRNYSRTDALESLLPNYLPPTTIDGAGEAPLPSQTEEHDRAVAGRLVLATDALAELGAFGRDEDPFVNQAVAELARTVPDGGLDAAGYRNELAALAMEFPSLLEGLGATELSDNLIEVTNALTPLTMGQLEEGEMAFLDPLPWIDAIADLLRRGGAPLLEESDAAIDADDEALFEFVSLFGDPTQFPSKPVTAQVVSPSTTAPTSAPPSETPSVPDLPLIDEPAETSTNTGLLMLIFGGLAGLGTLGLLRHHLSGRSDRTPATSQRHPIEQHERTPGSPQPAASSGPLTPTVEPPPAAEEPGSLIELLDASRRMTASLDVEEIATIAVAEARAIVSAEGGMLVRRTDSTLIPIAMDPAPLFAAEDLEQSVLRRVVDTGRTVSAVTTDDAALVEVPAAMASVGIVANGSVIGALMVVRRPTRQFSPAELDALEMLAPLVGSAMLAAQTHGSATALADEDALTGLANRRSLDRDIEALRPSHVASYVMIDVDHFKTFNDTNGHAAGDVALQLVAGAIETHVRAEDRVYRYGGEEFCVLLPGAEADEAADVAERVRAAVESTKIPGGENQPGGRVTISIGVADTGGGVATIIERADGALYEAKESGRNRVFVADSLH